MGFWVFSGLCGVGLARLGHWLCALRENASLCVLLHTSLDTVLGSFPRGVTE